MKVLLITYLPPTKQNKNGPTALLYYLIKNKQSDTSIDMICFKERYNQKESELIKLWKNLFTTITIIKSKDIETIFRKAIERIGYKFKFPVQTYKYFNRGWRKIYNKYQDYDIIWIYPNYLYKWYLIFNNNKVVMTGPDSASLHFERMSKVYNLKSYKAKEELFRKKISKYTVLYNKMINLDQEWALSNALLHVVGESDKRQLSKFGKKSRILFLRHPHFDYKPIKRKISQTKGKLTVLITGINYSDYIGNFLENLIELLIENKSLNQDYKFMFIGKGFQECAEKLQRNKFQVKIFNWVKNYETEISKAQIQLFPIILGTGTKCKVLSAFVTGLLCIGTKYAFENININTKTDCIEIKNEKDVVDNLFKIAENRNKFSKIADNGARKVREYHSPKKVAEIFWSKLNSYGIS